MSITSIPRFLLPRGQSLLFTHPGSWPKAARPMASQCRYASATSKPPKTRILEKPTKYNPPSHSSRTSKRRIPRQYPGPPLSAEQEEAQQKKQYPNMFPPEGTFMFWLLTNRMIHMWICLSILFSMAAYVFVKEFQRTTPFLSMLPPAAEFWEHPWDFAVQYGRVYKLHTDYISEETAAKRKRKIHEVEKRKRYREAHAQALEDPENLGEWVANTDAALVNKDHPAYEARAPDEPPAVERRRRPVKRWFGIWE
ncbi:MAG: hypothetical protein LQ351_001718 [Letrouitia transgressa]|nr:MAG: hypothetical protein LQ351_001718 [Letrouitia transgressa]